MKKLIILIILLLPVTQAANIALVVKNSTNLDYVHEYRVNRVLRDMGHTVTLTDTSNYQNYDFNSFSAIVIAGRPSNVYSSEHLDNFVATLPVNSKPTIVIDSAYPDDFGWIYPGAIGTVFSNNPIYLNVVDNSTMLSGFPINTKIRAHILNKPVLNIDLSRSVLNTSASLTSSDMYSVIAFAEPGILLLNGNVTAARIVFFGIVQPLYWSDEAELIFKNSVNWILNNEFIIPTQPFLGEYNLLQINLFNDGKRQFLVDLGKDGTYDKFWDPNTGFITNLYIIGQNIYAIDTNSDGIYDFVYDNGFIRGFPDLIVNSINFENEPIEGGRLNIKIIVKNQGSYIARNFKCAIFFDSSLLNLMIIDVLDINQEKVLNSEIINLPRGQHEIKVVVDQENVVFEGNENNNQLSKTYVISYQPNYYSESRSEGGTGSTKTTTEKPFKMIEQGDINITLPSKIELLQGEKVSVDIKLFNPLNYSIYRIYPLLDSEGLNINWYSFEPLEIQILQPNQERIIKMHVNIPEDAKIYTYKINFRFPSSSDYGTKTYNKIMYLQIKEKEKITTSTPTTTTISIQQKQQITGMLVSTIFKWTAVILGLIFLLILLWFYYPRLRKDGYIVGKGWKQKRRFL